METTIRLLRRYDGKRWQVETPEGGLAEFSSVQSAVNWIMTELLESTEMTILVPAGLSGEIPR